MKCNHTKSNGDHCNAHSMENSVYCFFHCPNITEEEKKAVQSRGGKGYALRNTSPLPPVSISEPKDVVSLLEQTINQVRAGEMDVKVGNCIGVLSGHLIKAMEITSLKNRFEIIERAILERRTSY